MNFEVQSYTPINQFLKNEQNLYECVGSVYLQLKELNLNKRFTFLIHNGFICDGLSVPKIFQWYLPAWDNKNVLYNLAGAIHDGLYANQGFCVLTREECDDVFRCILRDSGISRFKAGCADKCLQWFAGSDNHWGNDEYNIKNKISLII